MKKLILAALIFCSSISNTASAQETISLLTPYDGDTIETKNPLISWVILGDNHQDSRTFYRFVLVELRDEQSAEAGIITNTPLIKMDRYPGTQLFYPYDAPNLKDGHRYGWQIQKIHNNVLVDKSEAWEFILPIITLPKPQYHKLKSKADGTICKAVYGKLYFEYDERYKGDDLKFYIYDASNKLIQSVTPNLPPKDLENEYELQVHHTGSNFYELDLGDNSSIGVYKLVTINSKKQRFQLQFEVK